MSKWDGAKFELHDSELEAVEWTGRDVKLTFSMVTHTSDGEAAIDAGETWIASGVVSIAGATVMEGSLEPDDLGGGTLQVADEEHDNCIPVALSCTAPIRFVLETYHGVVVISGESVRVEMLGEPERCGDFPGTNRRN